MRANETMRTVINLVGVALACAAGVAGLSGMPMACFAMFVVAGALQLV